MLRIEFSHHAQCNQPTIGLAQCGRNMAYCLGSVFNGMIKKLNRNKHVSFTKQNEVHLYDATATPSLMLTYNSGANGHYISKQDQCKVGFSILQPSTWWVRVANGGTRKAKYVAQLPFCKPSAWLMQAYIFDEHRQDSQQWHGFSLHERGHQCIQGRRHTHHMQRQTHIHWNERWPGTIPNTVDETTGTMATTKSIQTSAESTMSSQQCLQSPINWAHHQMDAHHLWIPGQINLAQNHQRGQLRGLADADWTQCPEVLPPDNRNCKGTLNQTRKRYGHARYLLSPR